MDIIEITVEAKYPENKDVKIILNSFSVMEFIEKQPQLKNAIAEYKYQTNGKKNVMVIQVIGDHVLFYVEDIKRNDLTLFFLPETLTEKEFKELEIFKEQYEYYLGGVNFIKANREETGKCKFILLNKEYN